ncbi:MAG TPA: DUF3843 family protein, partial [Bacteroidetes bacterium]|nr:DUF3843 family protein [Bacteroidota bacterium]
MKRKGRLIRMGRLSMKDWLQFKPYSSSIEGYDRHYLNLCNKVFDILNLRKDWFNKAAVNREERKRMACVLVSYFEDFMAEIGIWRAFIDYNKELHGAYLPFYDLFQYDPEYINVEDITYLIWHMVTKCKYETIYAPDFPFFSAMAYEIYNLLESRIEELPVLESYDHLLTIAEGEDFFEFKTKLFWFSTQSYLMGWEMGPLLEQDFGMVEEEMAGEYRPEIVSMAKYTVTEDYLYAKRCSFAAMNAPEWLSRIVRCPDEKKKEIENLKYRLGGVFSFDAIEADHFVFTHLKNGQTYRVLKTSFKDGIDIGEIGKVFYRMSLIKWEGEWMMTGGMFGHSPSEVDIKKEKREPVQSFWALPEERKKRLHESVDKMYRAFVELFGSPLVLFKNREELQKGFDDFTLHYHKKLGEPDPDFERKREAYKKEMAGKEGGLSSLPAYGSYGMFYAEGVGIVTLNDMLRPIDFLQKENITKDEKNDLFFDLIVNFEPIIAEYLLQTYGNKNFEFPLSHSVV